jgi:chromosomal replication initiation ATPase DnaA
MNKMKYIAESINQLCSVNIYENRRTQSLVDIRSMACYILHKDLKLTLHTVSDHFKENGKSFTHCNVLHNVRLFEEVRKRKPELEKVRNAVMGNIDPKFILIKRIENINDISKINQITNCINEYEF